MATIRHLKQLGTESIVYGLSGVLSKFLYFLLVPLYTRIFLPEDYGVMSLVSNSLTLVMILVAFGLDSAAGRWFFDSDDSKDQKKTIASWAWCQLALASLFAFTIYLFSDALSRLLVSRSDAAVYFRIVSITLPLTVLSTVTTNLLRLQRRPWATVCFSFGTSLLNVGLVVILVLIFHRGLQGVYLAQLLTYFIATCTSVWLLGAWLNPFYFEMKRLLVMLKYALPLVPAGLSFWIVNLSGLYFIKSFATTSEVGLYQVGSSLASVIAIVTASFQQAWGPFALSIHKREDAKQVYADVLTAYMLFTCTFGLLFSLFAPEILSLVTTKDYLGANRVICLLAYNHILVGLTYIASVGATIAKTTRPYGIAVVISSILTIILNFVFVPLLGKDGAASATLVSQLFVPLMVFYSSQKLYPIPYRFLAAAGVYVISLSLAVAGTFMYIPNVVLGVFVKLLMVAILISAVFVFRITSRDKLQSFITSFTRGS